MTDFADLGVRVRAEGVAEAAKQLDQLSSSGRKAEDTTRGLESASKTLQQTMLKLAAAVGAYKLAGLVKDASLLAARYQTLGVVMNTAGRNAGYSAVEMSLFEDSLRKQGIAAIEARETLAKLSAANIDLAQASKLARASQDLAVVGGINSSEAFARLTHGLISGQTEILRTLGLNVTFEQSYTRLAAQLGKNAAQLTQQEKIQARVNIALEAAARYQGIYEESMKTAGKQLTSIKRYWDDLLVSFGSAQLPAVSHIVLEITERIKAMQKVVSDPTMQSELAGIGKTAIDSFDNLVAFGEAAGRVFLSVLEGWNKLPEAVQQLGIVGALVGGIKGAAFVGTFAHMYGWADNMDKAMALIGSGELSIGEFSKMNSADLDKYLKSRERGAVSRKLDAAITGTAGITPGALVGPGTALDMTKHPAMLDGKQPLSEAEIRKIESATNKLRLAMLELTGSQFDLEMEKARQEIAGLARVLGEGSAQVREFATARYAKVRQEFDPAYHPNHGVAIPQDALDRAAAATDAVSAGNAAAARSYEDPNMTKIVLERSKTEQAFATEFKRITQGNTAVEIEELQKRVREWERAGIERTQIEEYVAKRMVDLEKESTVERLRLQKDWVSGVQRGMLEYAYEMEKTSDNVARATIKAFRTMEDAIVDFVMKGKIEFKSLTNSIIADMVRMVVQQQITAPLAKAGSNFFGSMFSSIFHGGGDVGGVGGRSRAVSAATFIGAPRLHDGLAPDEFPAILQKGERVIPKSQAGGGGSPVNIRVDLKNESGQQLKATRHETSFDGAEYVVTVWLDAYNRNAYGLREALSG